MRCNLYMGRRVYTKIECAAHSELNTDQIKNQVKHSIEHNQDPLGRAYAKYSVVLIDDNFPNYLINNTTKYSYIIK